MWAEIKKTITLPRIDWIKNTSNGTTSNAYKNEPLDSIIEINTINAEPKLLEKPNEHTGVSYQPVRKDRTEIPEEGEVDPESTNRKQKIVTVVEITTLTLFVNTFPN